MFVVRPLKFYSGVRSISSVERAYKNKLREFITTGYTLKDDIPDELVNDALDYCHEHYCNRFAPFLEWKSHRDKINKINIQLLADIVEQDIRSLYYIPEDMQNDVLGAINKDCINDRTIYGLMGSEMRGDRFNKYFGHVQLFVPFLGEGVLKKTIY